MRYDVPFVTESAPAFSIAGEAARAVAQGAPAINRWVFESGETIQFRITASGDVVMETDGWSPLVTGDSLTFERAGSERD
jgi:hypothetical protein